LGIKNKCCWVPEGQLRITINNVEIFQVMSHTLGGKGLHGIGGAENEGPFEQLVRPLFLGGKEERETVALGSWRLGKDGWEKGTAIHPGTKVEFK